MGTEQRWASVLNGKREKLAAPPGFVSLTSFVLKRVKYSEETSNSIALRSKYESELEQMDGKLERSLKHRPWILDDQAIHNPGESNSEQVDTVAARLLPEVACLTVLQEAPVYHPTEEEFKDTLKYIASIRTQAESCGICRIIPPLSWNPPCLLEEKDIWESSKFSTYIQRINEYQGLSSKRKVQGTHEKMNEKRRTLGMSSECGSGEGCHTDADETAPYAEDGFEFEPGPEFTLATFKIYADRFKRNCFRMEAKIRVPEDNFSMLNNHCEPSVENVEREYKRIIENPTEEIKVIYGADLESRILGSGFPVASDSAETSENFKYEKSGWNLNNVSKLPGSLLAFGSNKTCSCLLPRLSVGMCFSSHCWKVEEHHLYSLCYMHFGDPKIWYGIPGRYYVKFKAAMKKYFPNLFVETPESHHKMVTPLFPSILKSEGIPVYRCVQYPREFVLMFPGAYHSGISCGFNCSEEAKFAPVDWLPHGQNVVELYGQLGKKTSFSHDKLLLGVAMEAVKAQWELSLIKKNSEENLRWKPICGKDGTLAKALKSRIKQEVIRREYLCNPSQTRKMEADFDSTCKRECSICFYDLYLSASGCPCSPDRYTCLEHAKQLCSCAWSSRFFLFRYTVNELNVLLEALEGKLSSVYRWAKVHLGLAVSSLISRDK